ncbi:MAG: DinB family protein [Bacteroidota bacterium]
MRKPLESEYPEFYKNYIQRIQTDNLLQVLEIQILEMHSLPGNVPEEKENYAYAPGKWTIKGVIGHLIDVERIFAYRALRFGRGDTQTPLAGFDDFAYVTRGKFDYRTYHDLAHEFSLAREANICLFKSFSSEELNLIGTANNGQISVRALIYAMAGHFDHHMEVIRERYLQFE